uniref:hypothetical protein n=1 Tax=Castellaniella defragrans TaxID=75697 RepID=UPI00333EE48B
MPYAANGQISTDPIPGGVEISAEQYAEALAGMLAGKQVSIDDGFALVDPPEPEEPAAPETETSKSSSYPKFSALEMLDLFTDAEQLAIVQATLASAAIKLWYDRLIAATFVTYEDSRTEGGLQTLVDVGLLDAERKEEIVAAMQPKAV